MKILYVTDIDVGVLVDTIDRHDRVIQFDDNIVLTNNNEYHICNINEEPRSLLYILEFHKMTVLCRDTLFTETILNRIGFLGSRVRLTTETQSQIDDIKSHQGESIYDESIDYAKIPDAIRSEGAIKEFGLILDGGSECNHQYKAHIGLTDVFDYCIKCDHKKETTNS